MQSAAFSRYRDPIQAAQFLTRWTQQLQQLNEFTYESISLATDWGQTVVWVHTPKRRIYQTLVFFTDFHTPALAWDLTNNLARFKSKYRLCLVEINGQPGLSEGHSPAVETNAFGLWATQLLDQLKVYKTTVIGQGMGALISLKLCQVASDRIQQTILINPAGIQPLTPSFALLRYYRLAMDSPSEDAIRMFLRKYVFSEFEPLLPTFAENLLVAYHQHALNEFHFSSWWNQAMSRDELMRVITRVDLLLGAKDRFFAYQVTLERACQYLPSLGSITVLPTLGHGIQMNPQVMASVEAMLMYKIK